VKFAGGSEGGFEPEARKVKDAERTGGAGTDKGNNIAHDSFWSIEFLHDRNAPPCRSQKIRRRGRAVQSLFVPDPVKK